MAEILAGQTYLDQSTPLKALLSLRSAVTHRDEKRVRTGTPWALWG
jgi:hypothetical protein